MFISGQPFSIERASRASARAEDERTELGPILSISATSATSRSR
jgi:hypothetical protein